MKSILLVICLLFFIPFTYAQKNEIYTAQKELKAGKWERIIAILSPVEKRVRNASVSDKINFYYLKGTASIGLANKKIHCSKNLSEAAIAFNNLIAVEKESNHYEYTSEAADRLKMIKVELINSANEDVVIENFKDSSNKFYQAYLLDKTDTLQLYKAAFSYKKANNNVLSLKCYEELKTINYSASIEVYVAYNKDTFKDEYFSTIQERDAKIQMGSHVQPRTEWQSKRADIYKSIALFYAQSRNKEKAIQAILEARKLDYQNFSLAIIEANLFLETKDYDCFADLVSAIIESKPNKAQLLTYFGGNCHSEKYYKGAEYYYKKAIETDPKYKKAYVGLLALAVEKSDKITGK